MHASGGVCGTAIPKCGVSRREIRLELPRNRFRKAVMLTGGIYFLMGYLPRNINNG